MLRVIVISLVLANLLLLGFQGSKPVVQSETTTRQAVTEGSDIPTIHLFGEMMQDEGLMSDNRQCFSLGPFESSEHRDEIRLRILQGSSTISERQTQALVEKGYWVFMPPYVSLLEANQELLSLQALGLEDIAVIYEGNWKNAISLGYFLRQKNALRRKKSLEGRGYTPLTRVKRQTESRYWLDYEQNPGSTLITLDMQNFPNDFMQRTLPCPAQGSFDSARGDLNESADVLAQAVISEDNNGLQAGQGDEPGTEMGVEDTTENTPDTNVEALPDQNNESDAEIVAEIEIDGG